MCPNHNYHPNLHIPTIASLAAMGQKHTKAPPGAKVHRGRDTQCKPTAHVHLLVQTQRSPYQTVHRDLRTACRRAVLQSACHEGGLAACLPLTQSGFRAINVAQRTNRRHPVRAVVPSAYHEGGLGNMLATLRSCHTAVLRTTGRHCGLTAKHAMKVVFLWSSCHTVAS